jgi:hypothetical protein
MDGQTREGEAFGLKPNQPRATWTGSPEGVFSGRKHHKPRLSLNNNAAGVCEREDVNRTRVAGSRDEVEGVVANTLNLFRYGASLLANPFGVGFIDWLDRDATAAVSLGKSPVS